MMIARLLLCAALSGLLFAPAPPSPDDEKAAALRAEIDATRIAAAKAHIATAREKLLGAARALAGGAADAVEKGVDAFVVGELTAASETWLERQRGYLADVKSAEVLARMKEREKDGSFGVEAEVRAYARPWLEGLPERHLPKVGLLELRTGLGRWVVGVEKETGAVFGLDAVDDFARVAPHIAPVRDQQAVAEVYRLLWSILGPPFDAPPPPAKIIPIKATGGYALNAELIRNSFAGGARTRELWVLATTADGKVSGFQRKSEDAKVEKKPGGADGGKGPTRSGKPRSIPHAPKKDGDGGQGG